MRKPVIRIVDEEPPPVRLLDEGRISVREHYEAESGADAFRDVEYVRASVVDASWQEAERQFASLAQTLSRAQARLAELEAAAPDAYGPDFLLPCLACWQPIEPDGAWVAWPCCARVMHLRCCQGTVFRSSASPAERCPLCLAAEAADRVSAIREEITRQEKPPRVPNGAKHRVCQAAGVLRDVPLRRVYDARTADRIDEAWMGLRGDKLARAGLTVSDLLAAGAPLAGVMADLGIQADVLFPPPPEGLGMRPSDLWRCAGEVGQLQRVGLTADLVRQYGLHARHVRTHVEPRANPEVLCALGITAYDLLAMGLRVEHMAQNGWTIEEWRDLLGADAPWVRLLFQRRAALEEHWPAAAVAVALGVSADSLFNESPRA